MSDKCRFQADINIAVLIVSANNTPPESVPVGIQEAFAIAESLRRNLVGLFSINCHFPLCLTAIYLYLPLYFSYLLNFMAYSLQFKVDRRQKLVLQAEEEGSQVSKADQDAPGIEHFFLLLFYSFLFLFSFV